MNRALLIVGYAFRKWSSLLDGKELMKRILGNEWFTYTKTVAISKGYVESKH